jgi:uncharacterized membrane protein (UPF0127 family)
MSRYHHWSQKRNKFKTSSKKLNQTGANNHVKIVGNRNDNILIGGKGDDILDGRDGNDVLTGGPGADFFVISSGQNQITDFNPSEGDQIVHRGTDEIIRLPVNGGTLITSINRNVNTSVDDVKPNEISIQSQQRLKPSFKAVFESGKTVRLESAESDFQQSLGMMQRESLPRRRGMMFPQSKQQNKSIYMFNCLAPLDILFLNDGEIVDLSPNTPICTSADPDDCPLYESRQPFDNWIELRSGSINHFGLTIGSQIDLIAL